MSEYGIKTSKPLKNIQIISTKDQQFNSSLAAIKVFKIIRGNLKVPSGTAAGTRTTLNLAHGYTKGIPAYLPFSKISGDGLTYPVQHRYNAGGGIIYQTDSWVNTTEIVLTVFNNIETTSDYFFDFTIYVFAERLA